jgi:hypothetical protein
MTLIELLVSIGLTGIVVAALSGAIVVILRQQADSGGRLNNARAENGAGLWIPGDLASAGQNVDTTPSATSCFGTCPPGADVGGSNALLLSWSTLVPNAAGTGSVTQLTQVSYRYVFVGGEYQLIRVQCDQVEGNVTCRTNIVLHNLDAPPGGVFVAGETVPDWIIKVSTPPDPGSITVDTGVVSAAATKNAQRVVVTVNGGGTTSNGGGGTKQISLSAGGTNRTLIDSTSVQGAPSLIAARSLCGGAYTLIIDRSGSIGTTDFAKVKAAVVTFVTMFVGTPVRLKLVPFDTLASTMGATSPTWTMSYNMLDQTQADALLTLAQNMTYPAGYTNWEDAMFRTFYNADGTVAQDLPGTVVFFTDGVPTNSRLNNSSSTSPADPPAALPGYSTTMNGNYQQQGFYRANLIAAQFRDTTRFIGVGVGPGITGTETWISGIPGYHYTYTHSYHYNYTHSYHYTYTHSYHYDYSRWYHIEQGYHIGTTMTRWYHMEKKVGSVWSTDSAATNATAPSATERLRFTAPFTLSKTGLSASAVAVADMATSWTPTTGSTNLTLFTAQDIPANPPSDGSDGWSLGRLYTSPYSLWEINTAATSGTAPSSSATPNQRVKFTAPFSFSTVVTMTAAPTNDGATSWTSTTGGTTNQALYTAQDNAGTDSDSTDGWTRAKNFTSPFSLSVVDTVGSGYSGTDPSWARSAKQYSAPFTASDVDTVGAGYSAADPSWSISGKVYSSPFTGSDVDTVGSGYSGTDPSWARSAKQYSLPYTAFDSATTQSVTGAIILARLVANSDTGVPATLVGGKYTNALTANMYVSPDYTNFALALQTIALSQCGGTLTLQTKVGTVAAADPFTYQKTALSDSTGKALVSDMTVVTTTKAFTSGTFDLNISDGTFRTVEIQPSNLSDLTGYTSGTWSCKAGVTPRTFTTVPISGSTWTGIRVKVAANEAVSCIQTVTR